MRTEEVAEDLADFWTPVLKPRDWEQRLRTLEEVHEQIYQDLELAPDYWILSLWLVAGIIHRLAEPPVVCAAQASIYEVSIDLRHRLAATRWRQGGDPAPVPESAYGPELTHERRRKPRYRIEQPSELTMNGLRLNCRIYDLSSEGACVITFQPIHPQQPLRLTLPGGIQRDVRVIRSEEQRYGLRLAE